MAAQESQTTISMAKDPYSFDQKGDRRGFAPVVPISSSDIQEPAVGIFTPSSPRLDHLEEHSEVAPVHIPLIGDTVNLDLVELQVNDAWV